MRDNQDYRNYLNHTTSFHCAYPFFSFFNFQLICRAVEKNALHRTITYRA